MSKPDWLKSRCKLSKKQVDKAVERFYKTASPERIRELERLAERLGE